MPFFNRQNQSLTITPEVVEAVRALIASSPEGLAIENMQEPLYLRSGLKMSYRMIEDVLIRHPGLFSQNEGLWTIRKDV